MTDRKTTQRQSGAGFCGLLPFQKEYGEGSSTQFCGSDTRCLGLGEFGHPPRMAPLLIARALLLAIQ